MADVPITELTELDVDEVHLVPSGANGFPALLMKAAQKEVDDAMKAMPHTTDTGSPEADEILERVTDEDHPAAKETEPPAGSHEQEDMAVEDVEDDEGDAAAEDDEATKDVLRAKERNALPDSDFAYIDSKGGRHLPINDPAHVRAALARFNQTHFENPEARRMAARKIKARARRFGITLSSKDNVARAAKSPGVPGYSVATPKAASTLTSEANSGVAGPMTAGQRRFRGDPSDYVGGESTYRIPAEARMDQALVPNRQPGWRKPLRKQKKHDELIHVVGDDEPANWLSSAGVATPVGGPKWEDYDAASLDAVARGLAVCERAVNVVRRREAAEAVSGDASDWLDSMELANAADAIHCALGFVARLAYHEALEASAAKGGRRPTADTAPWLREARDHLTAIIGDGATYKAGSTGTDEGNTMTTLTQKELTKLVNGAARGAVKGPAKDARKARREAERATKAARQQVKLLKKIMSSNNGGEVSARDEMDAVSGTADANDVNAVPDGGHVDGQYVNKKEKARKSKASLSTVAKELREQRELLSKMAKRPQVGGPVLDGVPRGLFPAAESRASGGLAKSTDDAAITKLAKAMEETADPVRRAELSQELTFARLRKAHEDGLI